MKFLQKFRNRDGDTWTVEQGESERLTTIGGFLMTHKDRGKVTVSTRLSSDDKDRGRNSLLNRLAATPIGTSGTVLWHPTDE